MRQLRTQVFLSRTSEPPDRERMQPLAHRSLKPDGGLWTSSLRPDGRSGWERWLADRASGWNEHGTRWLLEPEPSRIYTITKTRESLDSLFERFAEPDPGYAKMAAKNPGLWAGTPISESHRINYEAFAEQYDALHLTESGLWAHRLSSLFVYGWDCESTLWTRWRFASVREEALA